MSLLGPRAYRKKTSFGPDCETLGVPALAARSASRPERRVWDYPANSDLVHVVHVFGWPTIRSIESSENPWAARAAKTGGETLRRCKIRATSIMPSRFKSRGLDTISRRRVARPTLPCTFAFRCESI